MNPIIPLPPARSDARTHEHRCGNCAWGGTGRVDCKNYRPSQTVPYAEVTELHTYFGYDDGPDAA